MRGYTIFTLLLLCTVAFVLLEVDDGELLALETHVQNMGIEFYQQIRNFDQYFQKKSNYDALTWVDFEDKFYFDKETVDAIINRRFYGTPKIEPGVYEIVVTGYSSTVAQCGPNPFITASGQKVRTGIVATNLLPFGTKIRIPEIFGDQVFEVQDRMAQRYWARMDVWFPNYSQASRFGARRLKVEVF